MSRVGNDLQRVEPVQRPVAGPDDDVAVGLRGSSTILGVHFQSVGAATLSIGGTLPIAGKVQLEGLWLMTAASAAVLDPHRFQCTLDSEVPADQAGLDGGEQLFPGASNLSVSKNSLMYTGDVASFFVPVTTLLKMNSRRLIVGWTNGGGGASDAYFAFVLHRVIGGQGGGDPHLFSSEEVHRR